jgi:hypothetical protein
LVALPGGQLGKGLALRASAGGGEYDYSGDAGETEAKYQGGELALVYQFSGKWGWGGLSLGGRMIDTDLEPKDPSNDANGTRFDVAIQTDGAYKLDKWLFGWFGSLGILEGAYQGRLQLGR